jgi:hypothetical protein
MTAMGLCAVRRLTARTLSGRGLLLVDRDVKATDLFGSVIRKLPPIDSANAANRRAYRLSPPGPEGRLSGMQRLAGNGGMLVGSLIEDRVQIWLAQDDGELLATMWPAEYCACLGPLVVLDEHERIVATHERRSRSTVHQCQPIAVPLRCAHETRSLPTLG